jgi:hypothetical protein
MTTETTAPDAALRQLQADCGIPHMPTQLTYQLRLAVAGEGPRAYDWSDKPHRLLHNACREIERMTAERAGQAHADGLLEALEAIVAQSRVGDGSKPVTRSKRVNYPAPLLFAAHAAIAAAKGA